MNILDIIKMIPMWIDAKEPAQFRDELLSIYDRDNKGLTKVYDRGTNRFFRVKIQPVKSLSGWFIKRHLLKILDIMNDQHKFKELNPEGRKKLASKIKKADRSFYASRTISGTQARNSDWTY